ncbi:MAG: cation:proton antiporter [candidate division Zixibacteria bacterium]|nr:cation:proton antiporter [candidate division Zixibacteria bacterium]
MEDHVNLLLEIFLAFGAAKLAGEIFERLRLPALVGEMAAGVVLVPVLGAIHGETVLEVLPEIGVVFLLFEVGLGTPAKKLLEVGGLSLGVAVLGVVLPFGVGALYLYAAGHSGYEALFGGAALVATSVGITARIFSERGLLETKVARVILGAAVFDDILGMIFLAVVSGIALGGFSWLGLGIVILEAAGFVLFLIFWGRRITQPMVRQVEKFKTRNPAFAFALLFCLGLSVVAAEIKIAAIVGAFLAGMVLSDYDAKFRLKEKFEPIYDFFVPFFFFALGAKLSPEALFNPATIGIAGAITLIAILTKLLGCALPVWRMGFRNSVAVGWGMVPRGEVGAIVALVGLSAGVISEAFYGVVLFMVTATTLIVPPFFPIFLKNVKPSPGPAPETGVEVEPASPSAN